MSKIVAVAKHVIQESLRKKILFIIGLFFLILIISSFFLQAVSQEDKIKLIEGISFGSMAFFGVLAAIFLSATSLPEEIEGKLIQVVMTKPVGRLNFLLGKMLGFISVIGLLLLLMGALSWALVRITAKGEILSAKRSFAPQSLTFSGENTNKVKLLEEASRKGKVAWLTGPEKIKAVWSWKGLKGNLPQGEATFRVTNTTPRGGARKTELEVRCFSPSLKTVAVRKITVEDDKAVKFDFKEPGSKISASSPGKLRIEVRRLNLDYAIGVKKENLQVLAPPGSFQLNFLKGLLILYFELIFMVAVTVMGSTFLSSMVTITLALFVYLAGHMIEFLRTVMSTMATTGVLATGPMPGTMKAGEPSRWLTEVFKFFLHWFTTLFPDLRKFDSSVSFLIQGIYIPNSLLTNSFIYMSVYVAIALIIAYLSFRRKEFR